MDIAKKWMSPPYDADGWRLDVAADLGYSKEFNHQFGRTLGEKLKVSNRMRLLLLSIMEIRRTG